MNNEEKIQKALGTTPTRRVEHVVAVKMYLSMQHRVESSLPDDELRQALTERLRSKKGQKQLAKDLIEDLSFLGVSAIEDLQEDLVDCEDDVQIEIFPDQMEITLVDPEEELRIIEHDLEI